MAKKPKSVKAWAAVSGRTNEIRVIDMSAPNLYQMRCAGYTIVPAKVTPIVTKRKG